MKEDVEGHLIREAEPMVDTAPLVINRSSCHLVDIQTHCFKWLSRFIKIYLLSEEMNQVSDRSEHNLTFTLLFLVIGQSMVWMSCVTNFIALY